jgi:hypothetical protein
LLLKQTQFFLSQVRSSAVLQDDRKPEPHNHPKPREGINMYTTVSTTPAHQLANQGMTDAQAAWAYESMGNGQAAGPLYQRAVQALTRCTQMLGSQTPDHLYYCLGSCQVRLSWLTYLAGNPTWAQQWLGLALPNLQAAWQRNPGHPWYQVLLAQTALALGQLDLVRQVCQQAAHNPQLAAIRQMVDRQPPADAPLAAANTWVEKLTQGVETAHKCKKLFDSVLKLFDQSSTGSGAAAALGSAGAWGGGSWTGGWEALSSWGWGTTG